MSSQPGVHESSPFPVLYAAAPLEDSGVGSEVGLSLALLVAGVPSFLATLPVDPSVVDEVKESLDAGPVRVLLEGISVDAGEVAEGGEGSGGDPGAGAPEGGADAPPPESWKHSVPSWDPAADAHGGGTAEGGPVDEDGAPLRPGTRLPAAHLALRCADGRELGVARIVSRDRRASPDDVARYVLDKIERGVQIPDLASAG